MIKNFPIVALVGPPNAGKSTLLNKIVREQAAVTSELAGTTRDRQYVQTSFEGVEFLLLDTAGLDLTAKGELEENVQKQIEVALKEADIIVMVVDGKQPAAALNQEVLKKFRKIKKPKLLAVNKADSPTKRDTQAANFARLGIKPYFPVSAITGRGIGDMLEEIVSTIKKSSPLAPLPTTNYNPPTISVSIVGKPNVGKSSLFNKILNDERAVVSSVPGTTRTAIDEYVKIDGIDYTFIDTAGLKKKEHRQQKPDIFSGFQTFKSIRRADVCFLVIDAAEEVTFQDQRIAQEILKMQKGCIILANKFDLFEGKEQQLQDYISHHFPFLWMCPVFFVSAKTGEGLTEALEAVKPIYDRRNKKIGNQEVSEFLMKILKKQPPKRLWDQKNPKVFSLQQIDINPPTFDLVVNFPAAIAHHFKHYLENSIIRDLDFYGTPVKLHLTRKIGR
jgi:GTPase